MNGLDIEFCVCGEQEGVEGAACLPIGQRCDRNMHERLGASSLGLFMTDHALIRLPCTQSKSLNKSMASMEQ